MATSKPRIRPYIDEDVYMRLQIATARPQTSESEIVNQALHHWFSEDREDRRDGALIRRLDRMTRKMETLEQKQVISGEAFALFMRYFLTVIPQVSEADRAAAKAEGAVRFETYLESLRAVLGDGASLLFSGIEDVFVDESAFFTEAELLKLHEPAPDRSKQKGRADG